MTETSGKNVLILEGSAFQQATILEPLPEQETSQVSLVHIEILQLFLMILMTFFALLCFVCADNHDIISMKMYQLMVEHTAEEDSQDWTKIEPSVSLLKSPKGSTFGIL